MEEEQETHRNRTAFATNFFNRLHRYKKLLLKYWWIVLLTVSSSLGIQLYLLKHAPPSFNSTGRMIVNVKLSLPNANLYSEELNNFFGTQEELMRSESVRNRVNARLQADPQIQTEPVQIRVTVSPKTSIFNLWAVGQNPRTTQTYLQATMEEYIKLKRQLLENASGATRSTMQEELSRLAIQLQKSRQDLLAYQSTNNIVLLQSKEGGDPAQYLALLTRQLAERRSELQLLKSLTLDQTLERQAGIFGSPVISARPGAPGGLAKNSSFTNSMSFEGTTNQVPNSNGPDNAQMSEMSADNDPLNLGVFEAGYLEAKKQLLLLKAKRAGLNKDLSPTARPLVALNGQIAYQETLLSIFQEQSEQQLKNRQQTLTLQIEDLQSQIKDWNQKALDASQKLATFEALKENESRLQAMFDQMRSTLHAIDLDQAVRQEAVTIFEPATPAILNTPVWGKQLGIAALIGLVLGASVLFLLDRLDDRPSSCTEMEELFREPVLGQIALVKPKDKRSGVGILQADDDRHGLVEAYSNLRSALIFKDSLAGHPKSFVVTSAIPGDGKSMVCAGLAVTFAQAGARVLLVDADLRRGALHKHFSAAESPGFSEVLSEKCAWSKTVVHTSIPNLDFLPCGARPHRPASLFVKNSEKFIKEAASHYDYCLFDTTPVMAADDVSSLAPHVDGVLMVIRSGCTSGRIAQAALDSLYLRRVNVVGLVFNGVRPGTSDYYYYSHKDYHVPRTNG